jgi:hypothetical protein
VTVRSAAYAVLGLLAVAGAALVAAWCRNRWDLEAAAWVGDAVAPIVGVLSLLAVGAALWSVRLQQQALAIQETQIIEQQKGIDDQLRLQNEALALQRQALAKQDEQIKAQHAVQNETLGLQRQALAKQDEQIKHQHHVLAEQLHVQHQALEQQKKELLHQHEALEVQLRYQRHAALREAYAPFLSAVGGYGDAVHEYFKQMLRTNGEADGRTRAEWQRPCTDALGETKRALAQVLLVDTSEKRRNDRWQLSREVRIEPWVDTPENQRAWTDVVLHRISERTEHVLALRRSLHEEFGNAVAEQAETVQELDQKLRADLKVRAEATEQRIAAQLEERVKEDARRSGRVPPAPIPDDDEQEH